MRSKSQLLTNEKQAGRIGIDTDISLPCYDNYDNYDFDLAKYEMTFNNFNQEVN